MGGKWFCPTKEQTEKWGDENLDPDEFDGITEVDIPAAMLDNLHINENIDGVGGFVVPEELLPQLPKPNEFHPPIKK